MKAVMVDALNRRLLSPNGCDRVKTPNFARPAEWRMADLMVALMRDNAAPPEQFERLGLDGPPAGTA